MDAIVIPDTSSTVEAEAIRISSERMLFFTKIEAMAVINGINMIKNIGMFIL